MLVENTMQGSSLVIQEYFVNWLLHIKHEHLVNFLFQKDPLYILLLLIETLLCRMILSVTSAIGPFTCTLVCFAIRASTKRTFNYRQRRIPHDSKLWFWVIRDTRRIEKYVRRTQVKLVPCTSSTKRSILCSDCVQVIRNICYNS